MLTQNLRTNATYWYFNDFIAENMKNDIDKSNTLINNKYKDLKDNSDEQHTCISKTQDELRQRLGEGYSVMVRMVFIE